MRLLDVVAVAGDGEGGDDHRWFFLLDVGAFGVGEDDSAKGV